MSSSFTLGQRWLSTHEPELGLGQVSALGTRTVTLEFRASGTRREYARASAPLQRVHYLPGSRITSWDGAIRTVATVHEADGLLVYAGKGWCLREEELADELAFDGPEARFLARHFDPSSAFDLRLEALRFAHQRRASRLRGFLGGRIQLLPHQLAIAEEVTGRLLPRVLLADEVGLGKTIEACLILHRLLATGRVQRALVLVPEALVHQWFVELLRRFNLGASILDVTRLNGWTPEEGNPFLDTQLAICGLGFLSSPGPQFGLALEAGWDLLIVDEAHHLTWSPESPSLEYRTVARLAEGAPGLLLLTATPEQLGLAGHFARLHLLDPDRFPSLEAFLREAGEYQALAGMVDRLLTGQPLDEQDWGQLSALCPEVEAQWRPRLEPGSEGDRQALIQDLVDRHGTGRVLFRNTRAGVQGFPRRRLELAPLPASSAHAEALQEEWRSDGETGRRPDLEGDPRMSWLAKLLEELGREKVVLICRSRAKAEALLDALRRQITVKAALFHEGQSLVERDRGAAWFTEPEGARLLVCSEIGSEGRNFQVAHHLVLFDLPRDPYLLEQRIGRLDRIGQAEEIRIHVPFVQGSPQERLARWYHEGLGTFLAPTPGAGDLRQRFGPRLESLALAPDPDAFEALIQETQRAREDLRLQLEGGQDRLLALATPAAEKAATLVEAIRAQDSERSLEAFLIPLLESEGLEVEALAARTYRFGSSEALVDAFPGLPSGGLVATTDRARALVREDLAFLTWDHPLAAGALDLVLGREKGTCAFTHWPDDRGTALYLEGIFVLEPVAPPELHADRFLPPTPLRVLVDARGKDLGAALPRTAYTARLLDLEAHQILDRPGVQDEVLPRMIEQVRKLAEVRSQPRITQARETLRDQLTREENRLRALQRVNPSVRPEEIALWVAQRDRLDTLLAEARPRLDCLRLIYRGPQLRR